MEANLTQVNRGIRHSLAIQEKHVIQKGHPTTNKQATYILQNLPNASGKIHSRVPKRRQARGQQCHREITAK